MPISFKADGLYRRPPDAIVYIRGGDVLGTVAFYGHWQGVQLVCRLRGLAQGKVCICIGKAFTLPLQTQADGTVKTALFAGDIRLDSISGCTLFVFNNSKAVALGKIKKA